MVQNLRNNKSLISIKNLYLESKELNYFYEQDLSSMKNIETFELHCLDDNLELYIDNFDDFPKLKKVVLEVEDFLAKDIRSQIPTWKEKSIDLEVVIDTGA